MAPVRATAELLWTSHSTFDGMDEHSKEFCSLLNRAIREDQERLAQPTAVLSRGLNAMCVAGRTGAAIRFPPGPSGATDPRYQHDGPVGETYRGGGFDDAHRAFFEVGKSYRTPGFVATSFQQSKAMEFFRAAVAWGDAKPILWVVRVDPEGEHDVSKRCKHVNFVTHSLIDLAPGASAEEEYLFTAYSIFTVRKVEWDVEVDPVRHDVGHRIELDAASDNSVEAHGGEGRWATPPGSERLPLAPWY